MSAPSFTIRLNPEVLERLLAYARRTRANPETCIAQIVSDYLMEPVK